MNESERAWLHNDESFNLFKSWDPFPYLEEMIEEFNLLWENKATSSRVIPIPEALKQQLIIFAPNENPAKRKKPVVEDREETHSVELLAPRGVVERNSTCNCHRPTDRHRDHRGGALAASDVFLETLCPRR